MSQQLQSQSVQLPHQLVYLSMNLSRPQQAWDQLVTFGAEAVPPKQRVRNNVIERFYRQGSEWVSSRVGLVGRMSCEAVGHDTGDPG